MDQVLRRGFVWAGLLACAAALALLATGCPPTYPNCKKDSHCKEGEFCVMGKCQKCRNDADCGPGERCKGGRCEKDEIACGDDTDCPTGKRCKDGKCVKGCEGDGECGPGSKCVAGRCKKKAECATSADCPPGSECVGGVCKAKEIESAPAGDCSLETVYFSFDSDVLDDGARAILNRNADCLKTGSLKDTAITIEGHCDPRGTTEYNLNLSHRRAKSVLDYLSRLGVEASKVTLVPKGEEEAGGGDEGGWAKDRKAVFLTK